MKKKELITKAIQLVGVLTSAFGGALIKVQPPGAGPQQTAGFIGSFSALIVLLIIWAIVRNFYIKYIRRIWLAVSVVFFVGFLYLSNIYSNDKDRWVIGLPPEAPSEYLIVGDTLAQFGIDLKNNSIKRKLQTDNAHLVDNAGGKDFITAIWTPGSINWTSGRLVNEYIYIMIFLSGCIFSLTEGAIGKANPKYLRR